MMRVEPREPGRQTAG
ncbi:Protein of unknown function [Pyronema omphalodes CBS 100304]|uniref:Uncharacterized protein n=1 Tax=Pyronema omphalodes (strain CBS 100304) TaxID=1076935 RepID=U4KZB1_PYROM|nr:Protein of unknown function [Pyronema omphalodes CBS 100304]